jgi:membrane associated rhomboid family serine protease
MLPLKDMNPTRRIPVLTFTIIIINVLVFLWELSLSPAQLEAALTNLAVVPANISADPFSLANLLDVVRSMFLHAGWAHLLGNMLYLYLFGDNIEDRLGWLLYAALYFGSGYVAVLAQVAIDPTSTVVLLGASGAIAGVMGGYLILFPGVRIKGLVPLKNVSFWAEWPAWLVMGLWFVMQLFSGVSSLGVDTGGGGVAFFAHIGGFVFGLVLTRVAMIFYPQPPVEERQEILYQRAGARGSQ